MYYYLASYIGTGCDDDPFRPVGSEQPGWSAIDLRADSSRSDGGGLNACLLAVPERLADARADLLGLDPRDTIGIGVRRLLQRRLSRAPARATRLAQACGELLVRPPAHAWRPLQPTRAGRFELWLGGLLWAQPVLCGGVSASDDFSATANPISAPWTLAVGVNNAGQAINSHYAAGAGGNPSGAYYSAGWSADHFSQATLVGKSDVMYMVAVRVDSNALSDRTMYAFGGHPGFFNHIWRWLKWVNGTVSDMSGGGGGSNTTAITDIAYVEASGSTLTGKVNGVLEKQVTDTDLTGGSPGLSVTHSGADFEAWDTWSAGDLAAAAATVPFTPQRQLVPVFAQ